MTQPEQSAVDALPVQPAKSRILITLVVDNSHSMRTGDRIGELNRALTAWRTDLTKDDYLARHGEIALITFGKGHVTAVDPSGRTAGAASQPYVPVSEFNPSPLEADGVTPMVEALQHAFSILATRRQQLRSTGKSLAFRPLIYLITDGVPTDNEGQRSDDWRDFAPVIRQQENGKHLAFFAFGVEGSDPTVLEGLAPTSWRYLQGVSFGEVLALVSASIGAAMETGRSDTPEAFHQSVKERVRLTERLRGFLEGGG